MTITEDKSAADSHKMQGTQMSRAVSKRSPSKRSLRIAAETKRAISITVLDSFKIRDGRAIGDIRVGELDDLHSHNVREAALLRLIQKHTCWKGRCDR